MKTIVTHNGGFHTDDVFAVAALRLFLKDEEVHVVRSRDEKIIDIGDYVIDVGFIYDEAKNRFDHHQEGGAGTHANGIPYASFGLVWKKFGATIAGGDDIARRIDERLVQPIDAYDNGFSLFSLTEIRIRPFLVQNVIGLFEPVAKDDSLIDAGFNEAVTFAQNILIRLIAETHQNVEIEKMVRAVYERSENKQCIVFDDGPIIDRVLVALILGEYKDTLLFVRQHENKTWQVVSVVNPPIFSDNRKLLPEAWAGKHDDELARITGVPDAFFCHNKRFMAVARSKEGALALAERALHS